MNDALIETCQLSAWATQQILTACRGLTAEQLSAAAPGTYGGITDTLNHIVTSDAGYLMRLGGDGAEWVTKRMPTDSLDVFDVRVTDTLGRWERYLAEPFDTTRVLLLDDGTYEARAGVVLAQAVHHGHIHREQICATLTNIGVEPPDLQAWTWGEATGRGRELT